MKRFIKAAVVVSLAFLGNRSTVFAAEAPSKEEAAEALRRAVRYFREEVSTQGGYLWKYSADLEDREGEGRATATQIWVQPPGTPSVGMAYLRAYERTGDSYYLEVARDAAHALVWGQLVSGGWRYDINFDPKAAGHRVYRRELEAGKRVKPHHHNVTVLDDDTSQSALRLLMHYDFVTSFSNEKVHDAALYALDHFLAAQYPDGGWPQQYAEPCDPEDWPILPAHYPESWSRTFRKQDYYRFYTLNDYVIPDMIDTMLLAHEVYSEEAYLDSARRAGDFLILAQMPEPQPAWAQQYNADMTPAWARKFEPPSIVSTESVGAIRALMRLYVVTGRSKYLEPIPKALAWLERSRLPDGRHARFYELRTNRPLYFTRKYELVYTDDDLPTHYGFQTRLDLEGLRKQFESIDNARQAFLKSKREHGSEPIRLTLRGQGKPPSPSRVRELIDQLDEKGRWVRDDHIHCRDFIQNVDVLSRYLQNGDG